MVNKAEIESDNIKDSLRVKSYMYIKDSFMYKARLKEQRNKKEAEKVSHCSYEL